MTDGTDAARRGWWPGSRTVVAPGVVIEREETVSADAQAVNEIAVDLATIQQAFDLAERRARLALDAVRLNVVSSEEAARVVRAFLGAGGG